MFMRLLPAFLALAAPLTATPVISEFLASNQSGLRDEDGDSEDWLEIHNPTDAALDLSGWHLTDDPAEPARWTLPTLFLPPGGHLVIFASGKDRRDPDSTLHTNFKLSRNGEYLGLLTPAQSPVSEYQYPPQESDISYGLTSSDTQLVLISQSSPVRVLVPTLTDDAAIGATSRASMTRPGRVVNSGSVSNASAASRRRSISTSKRQPGGAMPRLTFVSPCPGKLTPPGSRRSPCE